MESPLQTMWKWHLINELTWLMADTLEGSFVHRRIAAEILKRSGATIATNDKSVFLHVRRYKHDKNLMLYGDLFKFKKVQKDEETPPADEAGPTDTVLE